MASHPSRRWARSLSGPLLTVVWVARLRHLRGLLGALGDIGESYDWRLNSAAQSMASKTRVWKAK
jgi:hypothetical protein